MSAARLRQSLESQQKTLLVVTVVIALLGTMVAVRAALGPGGAPDAPASVALDNEPTTGETGPGTGQVPSTASGGQGTDPDAQPGADEPGTTGSKRSSRKGGKGAKGSGGRAPAAAPGGGAGTPRAASGTGKGGGTPPAEGPAVRMGPYPQGVTDDEIVLAYYWKGDRTKSSPYLAGTGAEANVDESLAFKNLVNYLNKHADGGATFMGFPFDLHGRKIKGVVLEAGQSPETYAATAESLVKEVKPFTALAAHGSLSAYICPRLAEARIFNMSTIDLDFGLAERTNGYCLPGGPSWDVQVERSIAYLTKQARTSRYQGTGTAEDRVYGVLYSEYPGLVRSAPVVIERMRRAGLDVAAVATLSPSLQTAQQQAPNVVAQFRGAGVNTVVMPDAGAPLNFTHSAEAQAYKPDYYIWPCSGMDTAGMVRLFNVDQWERAAGLTCYDEEFNPDLTNDDRMRSTEWYRQYQEGAGRNEEPPSPTALVYAGLLPFVVGVTNAGPNLTEANFVRGLNQFQPYRYDAIEGPTKDATNMLLTVGAADRSLMGDVTMLEWSNTARSSGGALTGAYQYPADRRWRGGQEF